MHKWNLSLAALALCAALLAGCGGSDAADGNTQPGAAPAATDDAGGSNSDTGTGTDGSDGADAGMSTGEAANTAAGMASGETAGSGYSAEGLGAALRGIVEEDAGAAGGSLRRTSAAARLVEFAAAAGTETATLGADAKAWMDGLTDAERETLRANWAEVRDQARSIADDYDGQKDVLGDAGVTTDFSALDMSGVEAFLNTVDSIFGV